MTNPLISTGDLRQATNGYVILSIAGNWASQFTLRGHELDAIEFFARPENSLADEYIPEV